MTSHSRALHRLVTGWNMKIARHEQFGSSTFTEGVTEYCDMNAMHYFVNLPVCPVVNQYFM